MKLIPPHSLQVVDIGANPIDGAPPYTQLLDAGLCSVTGFEPQPDALARLHNMAGPHERYLPYVLGDGNNHTLHITEPCTGMTSLLEANTDTHGIFEMFSQWGKVTRKIPVPTHRLDDIADINSIDFLKIDVQGYELEIFKNGETKLANCLVIHTEVSFVPLYRNMPSIGDIDTYLRSHGFIPHCFAGIRNCTISPTVINGDAYKGLNQLLEADMVYVKDFRHPKNFTDEQLKKLAVIAHYCYASYDLAARCLYELENRHVLPSESLKRYYETTTEKAK